MIFRLLLICFNLTTMENIQNRLFFLYCFTSNKDYSKKIVVVSVNSRVYASSTLKAFFENLKYSNNMSQMLNIGKLNTDITNV